jgi:hypothetical protein
MKVIKTLTEYLVDIKLYDNVIDKCDSIRRRLEPIKKTLAKITFNYPSERIRRKFK